MKNLLGCNGVRFTAKIHGTPVRGKIRVEDGNAYLCQNGRDGDACENKLGYDYSWRVKDGSPERLGINGVTDLELLSSASEIESYKDWQVGDVMWNHYVGRREVIFRNGEVVILKDKGNVACGPYTCDEVYNKGWRLDAEPVEDEKEIVEVTLDKIA